MHLRFAIHDEACLVRRVFDMRVDFPVPVQSGGWLFFTGKVIPLCSYALQAIHKTEMLK